MTLKKIFRSCCAEEVEPEDFIPDRDPDPLTAGPKNSWESLQQLKAEIAKPAKTREEKPGRKSRASAMKRYSIYTYYFSDLNMTFLGQR